MLADSQWSLKKVFALLVCLFLCFPVSPIPLMSDEAQSKRVKVQAKTRVPPRH